MVTKMEERRSGIERRQTVENPCSNKIFYSSIIVILLVLFFVAIINFQTQLAMDETLGKVAPIPEINRQMLVEIQALQKKMEIVQDQQSVVLEVLKATHAKK